METIQTLLTKSSEFLAANDVPEPRPSAEIMLAHILRCKRLDLYLRFDRPVAEPELEKMREFTRRRLRREPVQYITGETEFYGLAFEVNPAVLIPRPDTEHLVERAIAESRSREKSVVHVLDIGTGSGCLAVTLCRHADNIAVQALDVSAAALETAARNARTHGVAERIAFVEADIMNVAADLCRDLDLIVSNPPYLTDADFLETEPEVQRYEPAGALRADGDGLGFYRRIAGIAPGMLAEGGAVLLEIGFGQRDAVESMFRSAGFRDIEVVRDYGDVERVLVARRTGIDGD